MTERQKTILSRVLLVLGIVAVVVALFAPQLGLTTRRVDGQFILRDWFGLRRSHTLLIGILLLVAAGWELFLTLGRQYGKTLLKIGYIVGVTLLLLLGLLKVYDVVLVGQYGDVVFTPYSVVAYPYTGVHLYSDLSYQGPLEREKMALGLYDDFNIETGDHGFFIDFDLDNPPPKAPDEFRIILIGGSGAQGWGAQSNDHMLYRLLENSLNEQLAGEEIRVRVINLAMASSTTFQNFIALNIWGHQLEPDLILSLSGINEINVSLELGSNAYHQYDTVSGAAFSALTRATYAQDSQTFIPEQPALIQTLENWLPGIMTYTPIGAALRQFFADDYASLGKNYYRNVSSLGELPEIDTLTYAGQDEEVTYLFDNLIEPGYIAALQSIKRDFMGIPIMVAYQTADFRGYPLIENNYADMRSRTTAELQDYMNDDWYFVDFQDYWLENDLFEQQLANIHYNNAGHVIITEVLTEELLPIIQELQAR